MTACAVCGRLMRGFGINVPGALGVNSAHCSMRCMDAMMALIKSGRKRQLGVSTAPVLAAITYVGPWIERQPSTDLSTYSMDQVNELVMGILEGYTRACVEEVERDAGIPSREHDAFELWHNEDKAFKSSIAAAGKFLADQPSSDLANFTQNQAFAFAVSIIKAFIDENDGDIPF